MPIKVAFLVLYHEAWDSLAEVWRLMKADPRFEVTVISIPRKLTGDNGYGDEAKISEFLSQAGVEHLRFDYTDSTEGLARLKAIAPDYLFINYPWQRNYQPMYRVDHLVEFTRVCYVPYYSLPLVHEPGDEGMASHLFTQRSHQLASHVFVPDEELLHAYATTERGNEHVHFVGSPKLDSLLAEANGTGQSDAEAVESVAWPSYPSRKYRVIWAPHHSYDSKWLNFGVFAQMHESALDWARQNPDIDILLRPHPFLFGTLVDRGVVAAGHLHQWLEAWNALPNTGIDNGGDFAELFRQTDLLVSDGISFLAEYPLITGKAGVYLENPGHWAFTRLGEIAAEANLRVSSFEQFLEVFPSIRENGIPGREEQLQRLREAAMPFPGQAAGKIQEIIAEEAGASELVDPTLLSETPWERRPGTESATD